MQFEGTAIYLYGKTNCTYNVTLDSQSVNVPLSLPYGLLYYQEGLPPATHSIQLTAQPQPGTTQQLAFDQAVFTSTIDQDTDGLVPVVYENWNSSLQYSGNWTNQSGVEWIPNTQHPAPYMETNQGLSSVSLTFSGGVAVAVNGPRNWGHWTYNISLDGVVTSWNCSTLWGIGDTLLFYENGLDHTKEHTIEMINTGMEDYYKLSLNYFTVYALNGTDVSATVPSTSSVASSSGVASMSPAASPSAAAATASDKKTNVGTIVGPIIAVVVLLALALFAVLWRRRRRPQGSQSKDPVMPFPRNDRPEIWVKGQEGGTPYIPAVRVYEPIHAPAVSGKRSAPATTIPTTAPTVAPPETPPVVSRSSAAPPPPPPSHSQQPSIPGSTPRAGSVPAVDVNQLVELIAQRIDPRTSVPHGDAPPQYPAGPF